MTKVEAIDLMQSIIDGLESDMEESGLEISDDYIADLDKLYHFIKDSPDPSEVVEPEPVVVPEPVADPTIPNLMASIRQIGLVAPITVDGDIVCDGLLRALVSLELGIGDIPTLDLYTYKHKVRAISALMVDADKVVSYVDKGNLTGIVPVNALKLKK